MPSNKFDDTGKSTCYKKRIADQEGGSGLMNIRQAAAFLGVSSGTLYHWVCATKRCAVCAPRKTLPPFQAIGP